MTTFLALYRGDTPTSAELIALSADQRLVQDFARRLLVDESEADEAQGPYGDRSPRGGHNGSRRSQGRPTKSA